MPTTTDTASYKALPHSSPEGLKERITSFSVTPGSLWETDDNLFRIFRLPKGAKILGGWYSLSGDPDDAGNLRLDYIVSNGTTTKLLADAVDPGAGGRYIVDAQTTVSTLDGIGYVTPTDEYYVGLLVETPAAGAAGNVVTVKACIRYTQNLEDAE